MKKAFITIFRPICRLISAILWQLIWFIPVSCLYWYAKQIVPNMLRAHFGIDQAQDRLSSLEQFADLMKNNASLTNPTALLHYLSAQFSRFSVATKLNTMEMTCNILQTICLWGLNILWVLAIIYAIIRALRHYRNKSEIYATSMAIKKQLQPQLILLQQEIATLHREIQELKEMPSLSHNKHNQEKLLPHD